MTGLAGAGVRAAELGFVLLLSVLAVGALALLGDWGRKGR